MQTHWSEDVVKEIVNSFILRYKVKVILTFDPCGVSRHINHMAVCAGVRRVVGVTRFELESTNILRKFSGPIEALTYYLFQVSRKWFMEDWISVFSSCSSFPDTDLRYNICLHFCWCLLSQSSLARRKKNVYVNLNLPLVWQAMSSHSSQFVWYRRLFIIFSRYSYVNTFSCNV